MTKAQTERALQQKTENPEEYYIRRRYAVLKHKYGISREDYEALKDAQGGVCAVCGKKNKIKQPRNRNVGEQSWLAVDHCHKTGKIRGLLCGLCNGGLGMFEDNIEALEAAVSYLRRQDI